MKIKVDTDQIIPVIEVMKRLPVQVDNYNEAELWVGCIMTLQNICELSESCSDDIKKEGE